VLDQIDIFFVDFRVVVSQKTSIDLFPQVVDAPVLAVDIDLGGSTSLMLKVPAVVLQQAGQQYVTDVGTVPIRARVTATRNLKDLPPS